MNFTNLLNKIKEFFGIKTNITSTEFTKYQIYIQIPKKKIFKQNKKIIKRINEYKQKYREILSTNNTIISKNLSFGDFYPELKMNTDLLLNIIYKHEDTNNELKKELNNLKLKIYEQRIIDMELETIIRGIALREVYHEKLLFLRKDKINAINEELTSLTMQLNYFYHQKTAIQKEKETYLLEIENHISQNPKNNINIEQESQEKLEYLSKTLIEFMPEIIKEINDREESSLAKLAYLETTLEKYVYQNPELIYKIDSRLECYLNELKITQENKDIITKEIQYFEVICNIFNEYGRNNAINDILTKLYTIKFDLLTFDIFKKECSPFLVKDFNTKEKQIYQEIIMQRINKLLNANNNITKKLFDIDLKKALKIIIDYLKEDNENPNIYEPNKILNDIEKLCLLLSFDTEKGLQEFYNKRTIHYSYFAFKYSENFHKKIFSWANDIPLETIYRWQIVVSPKDNSKLKSLFVKESSDKPKSPNIKYLDLLYDLYIIFDKYRSIDKSTYYIPDGITEIRLDSKEKQEELKNFTIFQQDLARYNPEVNVVCSPSLKSWQGALFDNTNHRINEIVLNNGLEELGPNSILLTSNNIITIPSSLKVIGKHIFNPKRVDTIIFDDFLNSKLLHNRENLADFLKNFLIQKYKESIEPNFNYYIKLTLENIFLYFNPNDMITISQEELTIEDNVFNYLELLQHRNEYKDVIYLIIDKLDEVIYKKTGYKLFESEKQKETNNSSQHKL